MWHHKTGCYSHCSTCEYSKKIIISLFILIRNVISDKLSIAASGGGLEHSDAEDSVGLPPLGLVAQSKCVTELAAMLAEAAAGIGLECNPPPCPEPSGLEDCFFLVSA